MNNPLTIIKGAALIIAILPVMFLSSCSVKERRDDCPSYLTLDLREKTFPSVHLKATSSEGETLIEDRIPPSENGAFSMYRYRIPKGENGVCVFSPGKNSSISEEALLLREGFPMDSLYGDFSSIPFLEESVYHKPIFHKQFSTIDLIMALDEKKRGAPLPSGLEVRVTIGVKGVSKLDLSPLEGRVSFPVSFSAENYSYRFAVPRVGSEEFFAEILSSEGKVVSTVDLREILLQAGFPWEEKDLPDARIVSDKATGSFSVAISSWGHRSIEIVL